jgi:hypothetical protein
MLLPMFVFHQGIVLEGGMSLGLYTYLTFIAAMDFTNLNAFNPLTGDPVCTKEWWTWSQIVT